MQDISFTFLSFFLFYLILYMYIRICMYIDSFSVLLLLVLSRSITSSIIWVDVGIFYVLLKGRKWKHLKRKTSHGVNMCTYIYIYTHTRSTLQRDYDGAICTCKYSCVTACTLQSSSSSFSFIVYYPWLFHLSCCFVVQDFWYVYIYIYIYTNMFRIDDWTITQM